MRVLLLVFDAQRRHRLAEACRAILPTVHCIECGDPVAAMFAAAPDRLDLVVLDAAVLKQDGVAGVVNWRRFGPRGGVLLLDAEPERDIARLQSALLQASRPG